LYDWLPEHVVMGQQVRRILAGEWRQYRELRLVERPCEQLAGCLGYVSAGPGGS
jgi:hypothetical protein